MDSGKEGTKAPLRSWADIQEMQRVFSHKNLSFWGEHIHKNLTSKLLSSSKKALIICPLLDGILGNKANKPETSEVFTSILMDFISTIFSPFMWQLEAR